MSLPPPAANQPYVKVSALEGGRVWTPLSFFLEKATPGELKTVPKEQAKTHVARGQELQADPWVKVFLAHDLPWHEDAYCLGEIKSL